MFRWNGCYFRPVEDLSSISETITPLTWRLIPALCFRNNIKTSQPACHYISTFCIPRREKETWREQLPAASRPPARSTHPDPDPRVKDHLNFQAKHNKKHLQDLSKHLQTISIEGVVAYSASPSFQPLTPTRFLQERGGSLVRVPLNRLISKSHCNTRAKTASNPPITWSVLYISSQMFPQSY